MPRVVPFDAGTRFFHVDYTRDRVMLQVEFGSGVYTFHFAVSKIDTILRISRTGAKNRQLSGSDLRWIKRNAVNYADPTGFVHDNPKFRQLTIDGI